MSTIGPILAGVGFIVLGLGVMAAARAGRFGLKADSWTLNKGWILGGIGVAFIAISVWRWLTGAS